MRNKGYNRAISAILVTCMICAVIFGAILPLSAAEATGYVTAEDVEYKYSRNYIANWGVRGEISIFLSIKALDFYRVGDASYAVISQLEGGEGQDDAHTSELYAELKELMSSRHSHITGYQETRNLYKYTDCEANDTEHISSFYSGKQLSGEWDSGATWNREHTWPRSKCIDTGKNNDSADIMMLRPTWVQENSGRGNDAYGESDGFFEPADNIKGDCARIALYGYTRWGNTSKMWGSNGMIESVEVLLCWMEQDPVDTWEMGRNDAVEAITGTRNVFVDYPEYAWLLFGEELPDDMSTPSGISAGGETDIPEKATDSETATETQSSNDGSSEALTDSESTDTQSEKDSSLTDGADNDNGESGSALAGCASVAGTGAFAVIITVCLAGFTLSTQKRRIK